MLFSGSPRHPEPAPWPPRRPSRRTGETRDALPGRRPRPARPWSSSTSGSMGRARTVAPVLPREDPEEPDSRVRVAGRGHAAERRGRAQAARAGGEGLPGDEGPGLERSNPIPGHGRKRAHRKSRPRSPRQSFRPRMAPRARMDRDGAGHAVRTNPIRWPGRFPAPAYP
jgi:hypothetical protein